MATMTLENKNVGDIIKLMENGTLVDFIIVHKGKPSSLYDDSCNGIWVLRKQIHSKQTWNGNGVHQQNKNYSVSNVQSWLNTYCNYLDPSIRAQIMQVKIPYYTGDGEDTVLSGENGFSCRCFLLGCCEVEVSALTDGTCLSYFSGTNNSSSKRIAYLDGVKTRWWLRSSYSKYYGSIYTIDDAYGGYGIQDSLGLFGVRPAMVLSPSALISDDGSMVLNKAPVISCSMPSGSDLGEKSEGFAVPYVVTDEDADPVTVIESVDTKQIRNYQPTLNEENTLTLEGEDFLKLLNGEHAIKISVNDGIESINHNLTFTKTVTSAMVTLKNPLEADDIISMSTLSVSGSIPEDAIYKVEVTNNANDKEPVWEDCTLAVKNGINHVFENQAAENGPAFNFRVSVERGTSNEGGYITSIQGGFQ